MDQLPLRDADDDTNMVVSRYMSMVSAESPAKRRLTDADSLDSSPSLRDPRELGVEVEVNVIKQEMKSLLAGHRNLLNEMSRLTDNQTVTEKNAGAIVSKIDAVITEMKSQQQMLVRENREMVMGILAQQGDLDKQDKETKAREGVLTRTTEQAFLMTERRMGELHQDISSRLDRVKEEKEEPSASSDNPMDWNERRPGGRGGDGRGLGVAGRHSLPVEMTQRKETIVPYMPITVSDPPRYQQDRYELFRKELLWWKDIHHGVPEGQLVAILAIKSEGLVKGLMVQYMENTRQQQSERSLEDVILKLDEQLAKGAHETAMVKINVWSSFTRKSSGTIRQFWIRWEKVQASLTKSGISFPEQVEFYRVLTALKLTQPNLSILMGTLESRASGYAICELKRLSIKLFEHQFLEASEDVLRIENEKGEESIGDMEEFDETAVGSFAGYDGEIYELKRFAPRKQQSGGGGQIGHKKFESNLELGK